VVLRTVHIPPLRNQVHVEFALGRMMQINIPLSIAAMFFISLASQVAAAALLPRTEGFYHAGWTLCCLALFILALWLIAIMIKQGVALNFIMPFMAASVPVATIVVAYLWYGQSVSLLKFCLLIAACGAIGVAGAIA
jgi:multidrug transporter EmrE-like cation transporter